MKMWAGLGFVLLVVLLFGLAMGQQTAVDWNNKGVALGKLGQYDEALKFFDKAIEINPQYAMAWYNEGLVLKALGRAEEAEAAFAKAKELGYTGWVIMSK